MRVTIRERLGLPPPATGGAKASHTEEVSEEYMALRQERECLACAAGIPSSPYVPPYPVERVDDGGPSRVRGEMVWLHKTAPTLVIEGRPGLSPEEHAAGRRR